MLYNTNQSGEGIVHRIMYCDSRCKRNMHFGKFLAMESRSTPQTIVYRIKNKCRKLHNVQIKSKTLLQNTVSVKSSNSRI